MNIITPSAYPKLRITMSSELSIKYSKDSIKKPFNEYTIFMLLEQERNLKLKEVYHNQGDLNIAHHGKKPISKKQWSGLPSYPPRYHNLMLPIEWFISRLNNPRRPSPTKASADSFKSLDQISVSFLRDVAAILRERYSENYQQECNSPMATPNFNRSMTVTPVPSPQRRPANGLEALLMASEMTFPRLPLVDTDDSRQPSVSKVDMSDGEIRAMWTDES
jgi:hypothetical protein